MPSILASTASTAVTSADWKAVLDAMTAQISVSSVVGVIAATVTAGIGLVFMWWGVRKLLSAIMNAFRKGKLKM